MKSYSFSTSNYFCYLFSVFRRMIEWKKNISMKWSSSVSSIWFLCNITINLKWSSTHGTSKNSYEMRKSSDILNSVQIWAHRIHLNDLNNRTWLNCIINTSYSIFVSFAFLLLEQFIDDYRYNNASIFWNVKYEMHRYDRLKAHDRYEFL